MAADDDIFLGMGVVLVLIAGLIWWASASSAEHEREWQAFVEKHNCVIVERREARVTTGYGVTANGKSGMVTTTIPAEVAWRCDDGVIYWR